MYIDKIQLKGRTLDDAILRFKKEMERIIVSSDKRILKNEFTKDDINPSFEKNKNDYYEFSHFEREGKTVYRVYKLKVFSNSYFPEKSRRKDKMGTKILNGKYVFSKHYGWIDIAHGFKFDRDTKYGGIMQLVSQLNNESGETKTILGKKGYKVTYKQSSVHLLSDQASFWVKKGLSKKRKIAIARAIVLKVSLKHEKTQSGFLPSLFTDSGFEPSDIPSNMLGVYHWFNLDIDKVMNNDLENAGYKESLKRILKDLNAYGPEESFEVYKQYPGTFSDEKYENHSWRPKWFKTKKYSATPPIVPRKYGDAPADYGIDFLPWKD